MHTSNGALASDIYSHSGALGIALITDLISIERSQQCMLIGEFVEEFQSFSFLLLPHYAVWLLFASLEENYFYCFASTQLEILHTQERDRKSEMWTYINVYMHNKHARVYNEALCCLSFFDILSFYMLSPGWPVSLKFYLQKFNGAIE